VVADLPQLHDRVHQGLRATFTLGHVKKGVGRKEKYAF